MTRRYAYGYAPYGLPADALFCLFTKGVAKMEEFYDLGQDEDG